MIAVHTLLPRSALRLTMLGLRLSVSTLSDHRESSGAVQTLRGLPAPIFGSLAPWLSPLGPYLCPKSDHGCPKIGQTAWTAFR